MKRFAVFGLKHSGKTSQGKWMAHNIGAQFYDLDHLILEQNAGVTSIREAYRQNGAVWFAMQECIAAESLPDGHIVLATGGGSMENDELLKILRSCGFNFLFIDAEEHVLFKRIMRGGLPPFLDEQDPEGSFHLLYERRRAKGIEMADYCVQVGKESLEDVQTKILAELHPHLQSN